MSRVLIPPLPGPLDTSHLDTSSMRYLCIDLGDKRTGLATLCLGGGNAVALSVERI